MEFRDALKMFRREVGIAQTDIATALHINISTVARWEQGKNVPTRSFALSLLNYAKSKHATDECIENLEKTLNHAAKKKLFGNKNSLFTVEHATISRLIEDLAFPIYVCDLDTDEILYANCATEQMIGKNLEELAGKKCYKCIMCRNTPCECCHKSELTEDGFIGHDVYRSVDDTTYRAQGKLVQWNGRRAQIRYLLGQGLLPEMGRGDTGKATKAFTPAIKTENDAPMEKIVAQSIENKIEAMQLKKVFENINGGVSAIQVFDDATSKFVLSNDKYYDLYGYTREEALAEDLDVMTLIHPEDLPVVMEKVRQLKEDHQPCIIDFRITKKDGSHAMLRVNASLMRIPGYEDDVITSVATDITERKSLEERLEAIVDNINGGISAVYQNKDKPEFVIANEQYYKLLGYTKEEFEAENVNPFDLLHPDDRERVVKEFTEMQQYGERYTMEYRILRHDGAERNILCNASMLHLFGIDEPLQLAISNDITEFREAQRKEIAIGDRLSTVMNTISNAITAVVFHEDGMEFLFANDRYYEMHGIHRDNIRETHLSGALNLIVPEFRERLRKVIIDTAKTGRTVTSEYQIQRPDGIIRWVRATISMTKFADIDDPVQVGVFSDITDEKEATEHLIFLNSAAHDILTQSESEQAIKNTLTNLVEHLSADRSYIIEMDEGRMTLSYTYEICADGVKPEIENWQSLPYTRSDFWYETLSRNEYFTIDDVSALDDSQANLRDVLLSQEIHSIILAPLWRDGRLIAFVGVNNPAHTYHKLEQLKVLTAYCTVLLTRRDLMRKIEHDSETVQQLMDDTPGGFMRMELFENNNPAIVTFNEGLCKMLGMTKDEVMEAYGNNVFACLADDDAAVAADDIMEAYLSGGQYTSTCKLRKKNGSLFWVMLFGRFVHGENGRLFLNAYFTDITEKLATEENKKTLLDNLPFGAAMFAYDGKTLTTIHVNKQYIAMVNSEANATQGGFDPVETIHPDDRRHVFDEINAAIADNGNAAFDIRLFYSGDEYRLFHLDASIVPSGDGEYVLYVVYERISDRDKELKETSERLKLLSDSIPGGIATFRCKPGSIEPIYYNDGVCALIGYGREEFENRSLSILDFVFDEDKPIIKNQVELLISGEKTLDCSVRIHTKNNGYKWVACMANMTGRESENTFLISTVLTDVTTEKEEREQLRVSEELNRLAINQSGNIISRYDVATRTLTLPYTLPEIFILPNVLENIPEEQIRLGRISPDTADVYFGVFERIHSGEAFGEAVYQQNSTLGWRWLKSHFTTVFANDGKPVSAVITYKDITEQREKEAIYARWQNAMTERDEDSYTLVRCNLNKRNIEDSWSGTLLRVQFTDPTQCFNSRTTEYAECFIYADDRSAFKAFLNSDTMLAEYHRGHRSDSIDFREEDEDGSIHWLRLSVDLVEYPDSKDVEAYLLFENIDEQKHAELSTIRRAETDPLTGVLNRTTFAQRVNQVISSVGTQACHALFMLDIDDFKKVNDSFGHGEGDQVLTDIANTLMCFCRKEDLVGRLGGDEFFVFISDIGSQKAAAKKADRLCDMVRKRSGADNHISVSIGVALYPQNGDSFKMLYKAADEALYNTKNAGKDGYSFSSATRDS